MDARGTLPIRHPISINLIRPNYSHADFSQSVGQTPHALRRKPIELPCWISAFAGMTLYVSVRLCRCRQPRASPWAKRCHPLHGWAKVSAASAARCSFRRVRHAVRLPHAAQPPSAASSSGSNDDFSPRYEIHRLVKSFTAIRTPVPAQPTRYSKRAFLSPTAVGLRAFEIVEKHGRKTGI